MLELIAKLEAASASSFDLNAEIARLDFYRNEHGDLADDEVPDFCSSIDAALTLVPDNTQWDLHRVHDPHSGDKPYFYSSINEPQVWYGATPAIAICIAALRRRASSLPSNDSQVLDKSGGVS